MEWIEPLDWRKIGDRIAKGAKGTVMSQRRITWTLMAVGLLALAAFSATAQACPNCRDALASDPDRAQVVAGYFWSIVFMVSMPFLIFTGLVSYFAWEVRRAKAAQAAAAAMPAPIAEPVSAPQLVME